MASGDRSILDFPFLKNLKKDVLVIFGREGLDNFKENDLRFKMMI